MRLARIGLAVVALVSLLVSPAQALRSKIQGTVCTKVGAKQTYNLVSLTCTRVDGKLVWAADSVQRIKPALMASAFPYQPVLAFTATPGSKDLWTPDLVGKAVKDATDALDWLARVSERRVTFKEPIITQPILTAKGRSCDPTTAGKDVVEKAKLTGIKSNFRIIVFGNDAVCAFAGRAEFRGKFVLVSAPLTVPDAVEMPDQRKAVVAHELGHTLGLDHSGLVSCRIEPGSTEFRIGRICPWTEYGDYGDFMGSPQQLVCRSATERTFDSLSTTQRAIGMGLVRPLVINSPGDFLVTSFDLNRTTSLYTVATTYGVAYIEFKTRDENACTYLQSGRTNVSFSGSNAADSQPDAADLVSAASVQVRLVGNDQFEPLPKGYSVSLTSVLLSRSMTRTYSGPWAGPGTQADAIWTGSEPNFRWGESIDIPNSPYTLTVTQVTEGSATIAIRAKA